MRCDIVQVLLPLVRMPQNGSKRLETARCKRDCAAPAGERRHIMVMFCDLVGSTSISAALDAEDWRDLVGAYLDAASAAGKKIR
jgi:class 3 adenylate cyclase